MISNLLNDKVVWKVLLLISYTPGRGYKYNEIKSALNMNNSSLYKVLKKLEFYKILKKENNIIKINFNNKLSSQIFDIIEYDKKRFNNINFKAILVILDFMSLINQISSIKQIILFGSYAKKIQKTNSDVDLAVIDDDKNDLFEYAYKIEESYGIKIEIHSFTSKEFKSNKFKLIEEIKRDGIKLLYE